MLAVPNTVSYRAPHLVFSYGLQHVFNPNHANNFLVILLNIGKLSLQHPVLILYQSKSRNVKVVQMLKKIENYKAFYNLKIGFDCPNVGMYYVYI